MSMQPAIENMDLNSLKALLAKGEDINSLDHHGNTPLHFLQTVRCAAVDANEPIGFLEFLLDYFDVNFKTCLGLNIFSIHEFKKSN